MPSGRFKFARERLSNAAKAVGREGGVRGPAHESLRTEALLIRCYMYLIRGRIERAETGSEVG